MSKNWIWITGADGHVGSALKKLLPGNGYHLLCTNQTDVDVTHAADVQLYADMNRPVAIINCAALSNPALCEQNPEQAYNVNALGARNLAVAANRVGACPIQMSTDDVFGNQGTTPYNEFDPMPVPNSIYGKSKLAGERYVSYLCARHIIIRSSWVYGTGSDFVDTFLRAGDELKVANNEIAVPTSAKELAKVILSLLGSSNYGTYHAVCTGGPVTRYEYAEMLKKLTGKDIHLVPVLGDGSERPSYSVLDNMMLRISGMEEPKDWKEALSEFLTECGFHPTL